MHWRLSRVAGLRIAVVAIAYLATALLGLQVSSTAGAVTLVWAPAGIGLAAVLRWGPPMAIGAVIGNLIASFMSGSPPLFAAFAATAAALEALGGAFLLSQVRFEDGFESVRDVVYFILLAGVISAGAAGAVGTVGLAVAGMIDWSSWAATWMNWSIGDAMGILIVAPFLTCWPSVARVRALLAGRALEVAFLAGLLIVLCLAAFRGSGLGSTSYPIAFLLVPPVLWAALRFRPCGATVATFVVSGFAVWSTLEGDGPFPAGPRDESILVTWAFTAVIAVSALTVAATVAARDRFEVGLRENQSWLDLIEAAVGAGTWLWDSETTEILGSEQQQRLQGHEPESIGLTRSNVMASVAREDRQRVWESISRAAAERGAFELDYRVEGTGETARWHTLQGRCIPKDPSRPDGPHQLVAISLDITERKMLEDGMRRSERLASLGTFAAGMAHEINNPIGTILLAAQAAQESGNAETISKALDDIIDDARRTGKIVKQVLQFAKSHVSDHVAQDLDARVETAVALVRPYARQRGVSIEAHTSGAPRTVSGSAVELEQVFVNLLRNAVEAYAREGQVRLDARCSGGLAQVSVHDDGCGISEDSMPHIFDPFFTTRSESGGSGLGLSICHGIIEAHGGRIDVASEAEHGTTFTISLPLLGKDEKAPPAKPTGP